MDIFCQWIFSVNTKIQWGFSGSGYWTLTESLLNLDWNLVLLTETGFCRLILHWILTESCLNLGFAYCSRIDFSNMIQRGRGFLRLWLSLRNFMNFHVIYSDKHEISPSLSSRAMKASYWIFTNFWLNLSFTHWIFTKSWFCPLNLHWIVTSEVSVGKTKIQWKFSQDSVGKTKLQSDSVGKTKIQSRSESRLNIDWTLNLSGLNQESVKIQLQPRFEWSEPRFSQVRVLGSWTFTESWFCSWTFLLLTESCLNLVLHEEVCKCSNRVKIPKQPPEIRFHMPKMSLDSLLSHSLVTWSLNSAKSAKSTQAQRSHNSRAARAKENSILRNHSSGIETSILDNHFRPEIWTDFLSLGGGGGWNSIVKKFYSYLYVKSRVLEKVGVPVPYAIGRPWITLWSLGCVAEQDDLLVVQAKIQIRKRYNSESTEFALAAPQCLGENQNPKLGCFWLLFDPQKFGKSSFPKKQNSNMVFACAPSEMETLVCTCTCGTVRGVSSGFPARI